MKKGYAILLVLLFLIQIAALKAFVQDREFVPQLVLLLCLIAALRFNFNQILWLAFAAGFLLELFSGVYFGSYIFALVGISLATYLITRKVTDRDISILTGSTLAFFGTLVLVLLVFLYNWLLHSLGFSAPAEWRQFFSFTIFWTFAVNLIFIFPLSKVINFFEK